MKSEDKELLLKDLCARLPYEVILLSPNGKVIYQTDGNTGAELLVEEGFKPYLRPMSSMTEEERKIYAKLLFADLGGVLEDYYKSLDYLNSIHIDYRGLIEKGLALEAPEEMYEK